MEDDRVEPFQTSQPSKHEPFPESIEGTIYRNLQYFDIFWGNNASCEMLQQKAVLPMLDVKGLGQALRQMEEPFSGIFQLNGNSEILRPFLNQPIYTYTYLLSIYLSICLCICLSIYPSIYLSIHLSIHLSISLSISISICISIYTITITISFFPFLFLRFSAFPSSRTFQLSPSPVPRDAQTS